MTLTTASISNETLTSSLLALEDLTNRLTVLALHATHRPVDAPRVREVFGQLLETITRRRRIWRFLTCIELLIGCD